MAQLEVGEILARGPTNFWIFSHFLHRVNLTATWGYRIHYRKPLWHHCLKKLHTAFFSQICYRVFPYALTIHYCKHYTHTVDFELHVLYQQLVR